LSVQPRPADGSLTGRELYGHHCSPCHGLDGDGQGTATRSLFPAPRNFRTSKFRLLSTVNGVPAPADLDVVLVRGIPGASMPSFQQFAEAARAKLIDEVLRLRREGVRESVVQTLRDEYQEDDIDAEEVRKILDLQLTPGATVAVPAWGQATEALIRQGQEIYVKQNCPRCHGRDGTGDTGLYLADEEGYPTRPRNLVWEEFKSGHDPPSVFVRIRLGLPGTPMAANPNLSEQELAALVHYVRSLAREPKWQLTNHQRAKLVLDRGFLSPGHPQ
jgi:mono/diheme cytochrome c family protein